MTVAGTILGHGRVFPLTRGVRSSKRTKYHYATELVKVKAEQFHTENRSACLGS